MQGFNVEFDKQGNQIGFAPVSLQNCTLTVQNFSVYNVNK